MATESTLLLNRHEVSGLLSVDESIDAVKDAFQWHGEQRGAPPGILATHTRDGGFHIKTALITHGKEYFVVKVNANFPGNHRQDLPTIQGLILIMDGVTGQLLSVMDSIEITIRRTAAATALAAQYLSRTDSKMVTICGCGKQGNASLKYLMNVRQIEEVHIFDVNQPKAKAMADEFAGQLSIHVVSESNLRSSIRKSDICVTCTPSKEFFLRSGDVAPGTFIAAVGADSEEKHEIDPVLFVSSKIVVDILSQSASIGDLGHAVRKKFVTIRDVYAELGEIVVGRKQGRVNDQEIIIFDSTGMAIQDAFAAMTVYHNALNLNLGNRILIN